MRYHHLILGLVVNVAGLLSAGAALADIPPEGLCTSQKAGEACEDPVDKEGEPVAGNGICKAEQCSRATPDGPMTYACLMCRAAAIEPLPGAGGAGGAGEEPSEPREPTEPAGGKSGSPTQGQAGSTSAGKTGSGSGGHAGNVSNAGAGTAAAAKPSNDDDGGCSIGRSHGSAAALSGTALLLLGLVYRRRRGSAA